MARRLAGPRARRFGARRRRSFDGKSFRASVAPRIRRIFDLRRLDFGFCRFVRIFQEKRQKLTYIIYVEYSTIGKLSKIYAFLRIFNDFYVILIVNFII